MKDYIFDIPVYRSTNDEYDFEKQTYQIDERRKWSAQLELMDLPLKMSKSMADFEKLDIASKFGGPWRFNQIIGWIRLFADDAQIAAEIWWVDAKRLVRKPKNKTFYLVNGHLDLTRPFRDDIGSQTIFAETLVAVRQLSKIKRFRHKHIDLQVFSKVGPFINWRGLMNSAERRR